MRTFVAPWLETLPTLYANYQEMVSVDETGEPAGKVIYDRSQQE